MALTKIDDRGLKTPIDLLDNEKIRFGTGNDLEIYHDGTNSYIKNTTNDLTIWDDSRIRVRTPSFMVNNQANNENLLIGTENGAVELYYDGSKKLETGSHGVIISGNTYQADNYVAAFGSADDLQIYHDGSHSYLANSTGNLYINAPNYIQLGVSNGGEKYITATENGAVELYYDNSKKFETTNTGINITGGIRLGGNNAANEMDDYEEGTWTVTTQNTPNVSSSFGRYIKIGNQVHAYFRLAFAAYSSGSGHCLIDSLPFVAKNDTIAIGSVSNAYADIDPFRVYIQPNTQLAFFYQGSGTTMGMSLFDSKDVRGVIHYRV